MGKWHLINTQVRTISQVKALKKILVQIQVFYEVKIFMVLHPKFTVAYL